MKERLLLVALLWSLSSDAQGPYELIYRDGRRDSTLRAELRGGLFGPPRLRIDQGRIRLSELSGLRNPYARFDIMKFGRRRWVMGRVLEEGPVFLYDGVGHEARKERPYRKIRGHRLFYRHAGDSIMRVLRHRDFDRMIDSAFFHSRPDHLLTRRRYAWLNTAAVITQLAIGTVELAIGFQSGAMLAVWGGIITGGVINLSVSRQTTLNRVRTLVAAWNRRAAN